MQGLLSMQPSKDLRRPALGCHAQALVFVRDLDGGSLGFCAEECGNSGIAPLEADTFRMISKASNCVINEVLGLRQLLKRKTAQADGFDIPRPILLARSDSVRCLLAVSARGCARAMVLTVLFARSRCCTAFHAASPSSTVFWACEWGVCLLASP